MGNVAWFFVLNALFLVGLGLGLRLRRRPIPGARALLLALLPPLGFLLVPVFC